MSVEASTQARATLGCISQGRSETTRSCEDTRSPSRSGRSFTSSRTGSVRGYLRGHGELPDEEKKKL